MHIKDPINFAIWTASAVLGALALYLYWPDIRQTFTSSHTRTTENHSTTAPDAPAKPTLPAPPPLSPADIQKLSPEERAHYQAMQQSLQQVLQDVHALDQENDLLKQEIKQSTAENQAFRPEIDKLRPTQPVTTH